MGKMKKLICIKKFYVDENNNPIVDIFWFENGKVVKKNTFR